MQDEPASTCISRTQELSSTCTRLHTQFDDSPEILWNQAMTGTKGKATPANVVNFITRAAAEDSARTSAVIKVMVTDEFGWSPDISTISRDRKKAGIPSSRTTEAIAMAKRSVQLTLGQRDQVLKLMDKFHLPLPDNLRLTAVIGDVGEGKIGPTSEQIYIRRIDKKLIQCWLTELEVKSVMSALAKMPDLRAMFSSVHERGIRIVDDILKHNHGVENGTGDISFAWLRELLMNKKSKELAFFEADASDLWDRYTAFGTEFASFRRKFEESQSVYPDSNQD